MRTTKELLELMLKNRNQRLRFGLCVVASDLYNMMVITDEEYLILQKYIDIIVRKIFIIGLVFFILVFTGNPEIGSQELNG